jgi:predicted kinase
MKSFLEVLKEEESSAKHHVTTFGRMNPPTTGHLKLIDKVKDLAKKHNASHSVVVSHSQDAKKNPLSGSQKKKHLERYSPGTHFEKADKEHPTVLHHAAKLHKAGVTHLHMVVGSDRVKEMHHLLHKYNGVEAGHGKYHFKKIHVHSAGHRDPDAEGAEGMSGTKMRHHAASGNFKEFKKGVPGHVPEHHAKELYHDVRKGMGIHESAIRGQFKAIFVTGGPGSGKDIVIREAIAESRAVELNLTQAFDYLADKQKLSEQTGDSRREAIRNRGPLIINGPADDMVKINHIKEELEDLGYQTLMVFVDTTNEVSQERNTRLSRMMVESVRHDKWLQAQKNKQLFSESFRGFIYIDNNQSLESIEEDITSTYLNINKFIEDKSYGDVAQMWLENHKFNGSILFKEKKNVEKINRFLHVKTNPSLRAAGLNSISPDNRAGDPNSDNIKWDANKRSRSYTYGAGHAIYAEEKAKLYKKAEPKESNFSQDKDKINKKKKGDSSLSAGRIGNPPGIGQTYDSRPSGQSAAAGAGLGDQTYSEDVTSNADVTNFAGMTGGPIVNPLDNNYTDKKDFKKFRKSIKKEAIDDPGAVDMGVGGVLGGATNKEPMQSYKDQDRNIGITITKKKKKQEK